MQVLVKAFEPEKMLTRVSCRQGRWPLGVGGATPEVDDELAVDPNGDGRADFVTLTEVGFEGVADTVEGGGAGAVDGGTLVRAHEPPDDDGRCWPGTSSVFAQPC